MARPRQDMTEAEQAILDHLWSRGQSSIRQIADALHPDDPSPARYATIQKQLDRMEAKGLVTRDRKLFVHLFQPALTREELIGRKLQNVVDNLCGGSLVPLLSQLTRVRKLSAKERKALRDLLDDMEK
jgi:predicted transcriptional regulator